MAFQCNFTLRAPSSKTKSCNLVGSWDNYKVQVPLSRSRSSSEPKFTGGVRFPATASGQRYWYYFVVDGHSATYDPAQPRCVEPTTGRTLNILDLNPSSTAASAATSGSYRDMRPTDSSTSRRHSRAVANGRALSPSQIQHPYPSRPYETKAFSSKEMEALSRRYAAQRLTDTSSDASSSSDDDSVGWSGSGSDVPSLSSRSSHNSSPSSVSSLGGSPVLGQTGFPAYTGTTMGACTCERYAITRSGQRVKVNCGGKVCQGSDDGSSCSSSDSEDERARRRKHEKSGKKHHSSGKSRRHGVVVRR